MRRQRIGKLRRAHYHLPMAAADMHDSGRRPWNRWRVAGWGAGAALLLLPLAAMQFTGEVNWDVADFVLAGVLLAGVGGAYELAIRMSGDWAWRAGAAVALATALLLVWANLAVGIIGAEDNPANLMFHAVPLVALAGAAAARLRPRGMARALAATALAQVGAAAIAQAAGWGAAWPVTLFFTALWLASAWLFSKSAPAR